MAGNNSNKYIKGVSAFNGVLNKVTNTPQQYASRERQYMAERTAIFDSSRAYLSTNFVNANVQGLAEDFYAWVNTNIRMSDISSRTGIQTIKTDDYKEVLFSDIGIDYFPIGAKIETMGNTWICINPSNISSAKTKAIVARCNTSYNLYDYYGNVITEPIIVEKYSMLGNNNEQKSSIVLMDGYFNVICQLNENTEQLKENSRIILGKKAYYITGMTDFIQEFSGNRNSCHLLNFTIRVEEPTESDDIENKFIAGGNDEFFDCVMQSVDSMNVGETVQFTPHFIKGTETIKSTDKYPVSWIWESEDTSIATVDLLGNVTAKSSGIVRITAKMEQNPSISNTVELFVNNTQESENSVLFVSVVPDKLSQYENVLIKAVYKENGIETNQPIEWKFKGARKADYSINISSDKMSVLITCINPSKNKLEVIASYNEVSATKYIELLGY